MALLIERLPLRALLRQGWRWLRQCGADQIIICHGPQHLPYGSIVRRLCDPQTPLGHRSIVFGSIHWNAPTQWQALMTLPASILAASRMAEVNRSKPN